MKLFFAACTPIQVIIRNLVSKRQFSLAGHDSTVSIIRCARNGKILASGQTTQVGFVADVIMWDFNTKELLHRLSLHKGCINSMSFSCSGKYLATLGGRDDGQLVVWEVSSGLALSGATVKTDQAWDCAFYNESDTDLVTCGVNHVKTWRMEESKKKLSFDSVNLGSLKRTFTCLCVSANDSQAYCGSQSGDLVEIGLAQKIQKRIGPVKTQFPLGISVCALIPQGGDLLVGTGDGVIAKISTSTLRVVKERKLDGGGISSLSLTQDGTKVFVGTTKSCMYLADTETLEADLRSTCHTNRINAICFPRNLSEIVATASLGEIRMWGVGTKQELLRIEVPHVDCYCLDFALDGKSVLSGWSDGKLRAFTPQSGKLIYAVKDAHKEGVTALKILSDCSRIVSGGMHGEIRIWRVQSSFQELLVSLKEHRGRVWSIQVRTEDDARAVSASADGSCIVWDICNKSRILCIFEATIFHSVAYHPDFAQILTVGSDKRITYYDVFTGETLRVIQSGEDLACAAVNGSGSHFAVAGSEGTVKMFDYETGQLVSLGKGHSTGVAALAIAPNQTFLVSGGEDGGLFFWNFFEQHN